MSIPAKICLGGSCVFAIGIIGYVHYKQYLDREELHQGVVKDLERRQKRKTENIVYLQKQLDLAKELKRTENKSNDSMNQH